jgi:BirA family transcriptional regulator, biotin operon repressor / biotin---[acetyl-CoA-carboxylase] ligase
VTTDLPTFDGVDADRLAAVCGVPEVVLFRRVGSTLDVAHDRAARGAGGGVLVLADEQTSGRGRQGRHWVSESGAGIWLTLVERPADASAVHVLSLRLGLHAAGVLDEFAPSPIGLKWPNDLYVAGRKLAGILVEARWREGKLDWLAIGFGLNVRAPRGMPDAGALRAGSRRLDVLARLVPALRTAASEVGDLRPEERAAYAARDIALGRRCREPVAGTIAGIDAAGALLIQSGEETRAVRAGSLVLEEGV